MIFFIRAVIFLLDAIINLLTVYMPRKLINYYPLHVMVTNNICIIQVLVIIVSNDKYYNGYNKIEV